MTTIRTRPSAANLDQGPIPSHLLPPSTRRAAVSPDFKIIPVTRVFEGYLGREIEHRLTERKEKTFKTWNQVATGEERPPLDEASAELKGWEERDWVSESRNYSKFSICERRQTQGMSSTRDRGIRTHAQKWWNAVCWHPEACRKLYSLKSGDGVRVTARVESWDYKGKIYEQLVVLSITPFSFAGKRTVPAFDFVDGEVVTSRHEVKHHRWDPVPRRNRRRY